MKSNISNRSSTPDQLGAGGNLPYLMKSALKGKLSMIDGDVVEGFSFGAAIAMAGEVVFNTGMVGYPEALTDPSYKGQILVLTSPMIGNYGVPPNTKDSNGISHFFEGKKIHISGLIVADYSVEYSHWNAWKSLSEWLNESGVPALCGIDTRRLTKRIREQGAVLGKIEFPGISLAGFEDPNLRNLVAEVSVREIVSYCPQNRPRIIAFDCGMKLNIVRHLIYSEKVCLTVVPYDYDLANNPANIEYDGIFVSNGPGDPTMCKETIASLRWAMDASNISPPKPIFGICLGNQLLALACGARTYKMKYGNRGMNQPCIDLRTTRCYITSQNHGYAVDSDTLPLGWKSLFLNANDLTNEGIIHASKPFFSAQFHPEAAGGPHDTTFLFRDFIEMVRGAAPQRVLVEPSLYFGTRIHKVLLIGSGGLSIGQAGEFDYSGSQAIKALKEEGIDVVLINPNIATVQTSKNLGRSSPDVVYFLPITKNVIEDILEKERPDGVIVSMGGQTALNVGIELYRDGIFEKYNCRVLGTPIETIIATEDREIFSRKLAEIDETLALSYPAVSIEEAVRVANIIGFPVLVRAGKCDILVIFHISNQSFILIVFLLTYNLATAPSWWSIAYALGGLGSGFAENEQELRELAAKAFALSDQILVDQDLRGWKEIEYEVVRDCRDNCITVCNMENFDPLGVHTGDSIVVAPSQTLSNSEYFKLRATSIKVIRSLGIVGECNIQYALNPNSEQYCIIEVNARLSRSSALASKATGYPLAYVATKLCLGKDLVNIRNSINKTTTACFEPSLDYCVVKVPRWDLTKFSKVSTKLGSSMTSVGEVMAIGRTFEEAMQKACRMVSGGNAEGLDGELADGADLQTMLRVPTDRRLYAVQYALEKGYSVDEISRISLIDRWFISRLKIIADMKAECCTLTLDRLPAPGLRALKVAGFSDRQIARYCSSSEMVVRRRRQQLGITPFAKQIDTLAAEYPAQTNYLYMTYNGMENDCADTSHSGQVHGHGINRGPQRQLLQRKSLPVSATAAAAAASPSVEEFSSGGVMVLGCGAYCIGSSVRCEYLRTASSKFCKFMYV
jgi:carbamoyl-phosphate synthase small subunit